MRRSVLHRLLVALSRLEADDAPAEHGAGLDALVGRLERAVDAAVTRVGEADDRTSRLAAALDNVSQGVVVCDDEGTVVFRNGPAAALAGARHGEALADRAVVDLLAGAVAGRARVETLELFGPPRRTLTIEAAPLDDGQRTVGAVAVVDDVSERRRLESVRRDFVANVSHELKTPVGALALVAETLEAEDDPAVLRRLARRMQIEAVRLGRIIDDLLDLSRIEDEGRPRREPLPVHLLVAEAVDRVRPMAERAGIVVEVSEPSHDVEVAGDRRQLVSALHNLLENAVKYSNPFSSVRVEVGDGKGAVEILVRDHGIGIPQRDLDRIFERFYRVDRARSRDTGGTGLGLAIVRHVADNHEGAVEVTSHEGEGSTFTLRLPAGRPPSAVASGGDGPAASDA
jgi:two-component system sensor histidine kinase SenX3